MNPHPDTFQVAPTMTDTSRPVNRPVNQYIQQALRDSRQASAAMGEQLREQERARLQAIVDRWMPVATGPHRTKEAARAMEIVRKASESLRLLLGLHVAASMPKTVPSVVAAVEAPPTPPEPVEAPDPEPSPDQRLLYLAFDDIALRMAKAGLLTTSS